MASSRLVNHVGPLAVPGIDSVYPFFSEAIRTYELDANAPFLCPIGIE